MEIAAKWVVLEPMMLLETFTFGAYVTQQNVYKDKINEVYQNSTTEDVERVTANFFR